MNQQQSNFAERVKKWAKANYFNVTDIEDKFVHLSRMSDGHPFEVNARLLEQIMTDEGF